MRGVVVKLLVAAVVLTQAFASMGRGACPGMAGEEAPACCCEDEGACPCCTPPDQSRRDEPGPRSGPCACDCAPATNERRVAAPSESARRVVERAWEACPAPGPAPWEFAAPRAGVMPSPCESPPATARADSTGLDSIRLRV